MPHQSEIASSDMKEHAEKLKALLISMVSPTYIHTYIAILIKQNSMQINFYDIDAHSTCIQ